ncbi:MAG: GTPase ObgE [Christensenellales bacterium]
MFIDEVKIRIKAGDGGNGCVSFRREKYVPAGGPDGGDGGHGGNLIFQVALGMSTLMDFRYRRKFFAQNGEDGRSSNRQGKTGEDLVVVVPPGTVVKDGDGRIILDMADDETPRILLRGGRGGYGNTRFANSVRQAPKFAQNGSKTLEMEVTLELRCIADVGLVGFPNVGKSTLLSVVSSARPKIANYHFTTLRPNLGLVDMEGARFVVADIPGIIEGAHEGVGLGHKFLRHVERTRVLIHVLDMSGCEGRDPLEDYEIMCRELAAYSQTLAARPFVVAANKMDITGAQENLDRFLAAYPDLEVFPISAAVNQGILKLMQRAGAILATLPPPERFYEQAVVEPVRQEGYEIAVEEGAFVVSGPTIDSLLDSTYRADVDSMRRFQKVLVREGIIDALRKKGAQHGDTVYLADFAFDFVD